MIHFSLEPPYVDFIFAKRNVNMITNVLASNYILNNKMDLSIKLRYHLDQVRNLEFNKLNDEVHLYESNYFVITILITQHGHQILSLIGGFYLEVK